MSEKEVDYGRMLTGLSSGIGALYKHGQYLKDLRVRLLEAVGDIERFLTSKPMKDALSWYEAISKEHDAELKARYEQERREPQLHAGMLICQECGADRADPYSACPKGADHRCPMIAKA